MIALALAVGLTIAAPADSAPAAPAPADTSLHRFLDTLADSTDRYFGLVAAPTDTAGLDSALSARLERPWGGPRLRRRLTILPEFEFNRVDGALWGASASLRSPGERFGISGDAGYATGPHRWLGGGEILAGIRRRELLARLSVRGGWRTAVMDRDAEGPFFATMLALISGGDRRSYLRREGFSVRLGAGTPAWFGGLEYRDWVEGPLAVTTTWNLRKKPLEMPGNLGASPGRTRSLELEAGARWPVLPLTSQVVHEISSRSLGSDFEFQRLRATLGGEFPVARLFSLLPQLLYGRLSGEPTPQAAFYLGGARTLRSLPGAALGGTGMAVARLDIMGADDVLAWLHVPHPAMFPIQWGLFAATAAVWGPDPYGGPGTPGGNWPGRGAWLSEAGVTLLYRPGIPDEEGYMRFNYAWPLGPDARTGRFSIAYSRPLDLLRPF
jgi:hypothetical protein